MAFFLVNTVCSNKNKLLCMGSLVGQSDDIGSTQKKRFSFDQQVFYVVWMKRISSTS